MHSRRSNRVAFRGILVLRWAAMTGEVLIPTSVDEAASLFGEGGAVTVFAGGTILLPEIAAGRLAPEWTLMLHRCGLDRVTHSDERVVIGAMTPIQALVDGPEEILARFAAHVADSEVRRNATVGGNICAPPGRESQRGDLGAPLIALGARVRSTGSGGERTDAIEDFLTGDRGKRLVLAVEYDRFPRRSGASFMRRRHAHSYAIAAVAACSREDGSDLRVAVSGTGARASRSRSVETTRDPASVLADLEPVDDAVASAAYRRAVLPPLVRDALDRLGPA
jgi:CO/xanthine dehydrogenase FAD-binding subunit